MPTGARHCRAFPSQNAWLRLIRGTRSLEVPQSANHVLTTRCTAPPGPAPLASRRYSYAERSRTHNNRDTRGQHIHFLRTSIPRACKLPYSGSLIRALCQRTPRFAILLADYQVELGLLGDGQHAPLAPITWILRRRTRHHHPHGTNQKWSRYNRSSLALTTSSCRRSYICSRSARCGEIFVTDIRGALLLDSRAV